jgi:hypothetical protein
MVIAEDVIIHYETSAYRTLSSENDMHILDYTTNLKPPQNGSQIKYPDPKICDQMIVPCS